MIMIDSRVCHHNSMSLSISILQPSCYEQCVLVVYVRSAVCSVHWSAAIVRDPGVCGETQPQYEVAIVPFTFTVTPIHFRNVYPIFV